MRSSHAPPAEACISREDCRAKDWGLAMHSDARKPMQTIATKLFCATQLTAYGSIVSSCMDLQDNDEPAQLWESLLATCKRLYSHNKQFAKELEEEKARSAALHTQLAEMQVRTRDHGAPTSRRQTLGCDSTQKCRHVICLRERLVSDLRRARCACRTWRGARPHQSTVHKRYVWMLTTQGLHSAALRKAAGRQCLHGLPHPRTERV